MHSEQQHPLNSFTHSLQHLKPNPTNKLIPLSKALPWALALYQRLVIKEKGMESSKTSRSKLTGIVDCNRDSHNYGALIEKPGKYIYSIWQKHYSQKIGWFCMIQLRGCRQMEAVRVVSRTQINFQPIAHYLHLLDN